MSTGDDLKRIIAEVEQQDDVTFWSRQLTEHALFLFLMLENEKMKERAFELFTAWSDATGRLTTTLLANLVEKLDRFQTDIKIKLDNKEWIGWVFPSFLDHIKKEMKYFVDKLNGKQTALAEEINFWNQHGTEEAELTAHLLDPSEKEGIIKAYHLAGKMSDIADNDVNQLILISLNAQRDFTHFQLESKIAKPKSVILPLIIDHVVREMARGLVTIRNLSLEQ